jgi:hypothetical protein
MKKITVVAFVASLLFSQAANAQVPDLRGGNYWYSECTPKKTDAERATCFTYILGFSDGLFIQASLTGTEEKACRPSGATISQMADIFYAFLRDRPESRDKPASILLMAAMAKAFPCPDKAIANSGKK